MSRDRLPLAQLDEEPPMQSFIMLTRIAPEAMRSPKSLEELERTAMDRVRTTCTQVKWIANYAVLGPCDYLDVFEAPDVRLAPASRATTTRSRRSPRPT